VVIVGLFLISFEFLICLLPDWYLIFILVGIAGFGSELVESSVGTIILEVTKKKQAMTMSKLEVAYGLGALLIPLLASLLISKGIWEFSFLVLGASPIWITWL